MTVACYREHADGSRHLAKRLNDAAVQKHLLEIASAYDALAVRAERGRHSRCRC